MFTSFVSASEQLWAANPAACPSTQGAVSCDAAGSNEHICGEYICYVSDLVFAPTDSETASQPIAGAPSSGGFIVDCYSNDATDAPCDNGGQAWCSPKQSCEEGNLETICTANAWGDATCGTCKDIDGDSVEDFGDCNGDAGDGCEVQFSSTAFNANHVIYGSSCSETAENLQCEPNFYACNNGGDKLDADGCEVQENDACEIGGFPGGFMQGCECTSNPSPFQTGMESFFSSVTGIPLLWGTQAGEGDLLKLNDFIISNDGSISLNGIKIIDFNGEWVGPSTGIVPLTHFDDEPVGPNCDAGGKKITFYSEEGSTSGYQSGTDELIGETYACHGKGIVSIDHETDGSLTINYVDGSNQTTNDITGPKGEAVLSGIIEPISTVGTIDDLYLNTISGKVFKKTDATTWTEVIATIIGADGPAGPIAGTDGQFVFNDAGAAAGANVNYDSANTWVGIGKVPSTALDIVGTVTADFFSGNGAALTNLNPANIVGLGALALLDTINTDQIDDLAVTTEKLAANSVTSDKILDETITADDIHPDTIATLNSEADTLSTVAGRGSTTTADITANSFIGDGSQLTGIVKEYSVEVVAEKMNGFIWAGDPLAINVIKNRVDTATGGSASVFRRSGGAWLSTGDITRGEQLRIQTIGGTHAIVNLAVFPNTNSMNIDNFANSLRINGIDVIDDAGNWIGSPTGLIGADGVTWISGNAAPTAANIGKDGDFYLDSSTGDVYKRVSLNWALFTNLKGPQGFPGLDGINMGVYTTASGTSGSCPFDGLNVLIYEDTDSDGAYTGADTFIAEENICNGEPGPIAGTDGQLVYNDAGAAAGAEVYYNNGNVGIGINAPLQKLDIFNPTGASELVLSGNSNDNNAIKLYTARPDTTKTLEESNAGSGNKGWMITAYGEDMSDPGTLLFDYFDDATWNSGLAIKKNGNVGIGTPTPNAMLHIEGDGYGGEHEVYIEDGTLTVGTNTDGIILRSGAGYGGIIPAVSNNLELQGHNDQDVIVKIGGMGDSNFIVKEATGGDENLLTVTNEGNVGMGTTSPSPHANLHVYDAGTGIEDFSAIKIDSAKDSILAFSKNGLNNWLFKTAGDSFILGNNDANPAVPYSGRNFLIIDKDRNFDFLGDVNIRNLGTNSKALSVEGNISGRGLTLTAADPSDLALRISGEALFSNHVQINELLIPDYFYSQADVITQNNFVGTNMTLSGNLVISNNEAEIILHDNNGRGGLGNYVNLLNDGGVLQIGNDEPTSPTQILLDGEMYADYFIGDGSRLTGIETGKWNDGTTNGIIYNEKVGIGAITDPEELLHLKGANHGNYIKVETVDSQGTGLKLKNANNDWTISADATENRLGINKGFFSDILSITSDNRVGVNNQNPTEALDVNGNINAAGDLTTTGTICDGNGNCLDSLSSNSLSSADGDPVDVVYVDDDGNVGIGTTLPKGKLDVDGFVMGSKLDIDGNGVFTITDMYIIYNYENVYLPLISQGLGSPEDLIGNYVDDLTFATNTPQEMVDAVELIYDDLDLDGDGQFNFGDLIVLTRYLRGEDMDDLNLVARSEEEIREYIFDMFGQTFTSASFFRQIIEFEERIGIGTNTPITKLDVFGDFRIVNDAETTFNVNLDGNVGIGTPNPTVRLDVDSGSSAVQGDTGGSATIGHSDNIATGDYAIAMGSETIAEGQASTAMGLQTTATGSASTAMGGVTYGTGHFSTAMGHLSHAYGPYSTAMGQGGWAIGSVSTVMGKETRAEGPYSTAMGHNTIAVGQASIAMGYQTTAVGGASTAIGSNTRAVGSDSIALGYYTIASGTHSIATGRGIEAQGDYSIAIGLNDQTGTVVTQDNTMAIMGGNVGIGTSQPEGILDVKSDFTIGLNEEHAETNAAGGLEQTFKAPTNDALKTLRVYAPTTTPSSVKLILYNGIQTNQNGVGSFLYEDVVGVKSSDGWINYDISSFGTFNLVKDQTYTFHLIGGSCKANQNNAYPDGHSSSADLDLVFQLLFDTPKSALKVDAGKVIVNNLKINCPAEFVSIEGGQNRQLGCMQINQGSGTTKDWYDATMYCFDEFGGRLPTQEEWHISAARFNTQLTGIDGDLQREWLSDSAYHGSYRGTIYKAASGKSLLWFSADTASNQFRCWIPK
mgnify:FL=1